MSLALLKDKIYRAVENSDDAHLLEEIFTMFTKNTRFSGYEFNQSNVFLSDDRKTQKKGAESKNYAVNEVKKKILENLDK